MRDCPLKQQTLIPPPYHYQERQMFTFTDIVNIAIQIEKNGEQTYRSAGIAARNPETATRLIWMADQENQHAQWLKSISSTVTMTDEQKEMAEVGKTLLQEMIKGNEFLLSRNELERSESVDEILAKSKSFEQDTILFYQFLLDLLEDQESVMQMRRIIDEEKNHIHKLEDLEKASAREQIHTR